MFKRAYWSPSMNLPLSARTNWPASALEDVGVGAVEVPVVACTAPKWITGRSDPRRNLRNNILELSDRPLR
jgi:hypothetical protein